jgi:hypothetical protein
MSVKDTIQQQIDSFDNEQIFTIDELKFSKKNTFSVSNALSMLQKEGYINRLARRFYYKPRKSSVTGNPLPINGGKLINYFATNSGGYLTGTDVYRQMGLTTQMSFVYTIATPQKRKKLIAENHQLQFVKAYCKPTEKNIHLLRILDAIQDLKTIPDCPIDEAAKLLMAQIFRLSHFEIREFVKCAKHYPPRVRAVVGALLLQLKFEKEAAILQKTINPLSKFDVGISGKTLRTKQQFHIL